MNLPKLLIPLALFLATSAMAQAGTQVKETWNAKWAGQKCTLVLSYDNAKLAGPVKVKGGCGKALRKVKSFVYTDAKHSQMILFTKKNARGAPVGIFDKAGKKNFKGLIGDGTSAKMFRTSISTVTVSVGTGSNLSANTNAQTGEVAGDIGNCIRYANRQKCASKADKKNPNIPTFKTIEMRALADQSVFPFSGGRGFARDESVVKGATVTVKKCERAFNSDEDWCEIVLSDGFFTGWVKRMVDKKVYLRGL